MIQKTLSFLILLLTCHLVIGQQSKNQVIKNIEAWYKLHPELYSITLDKKSSEAEITRYHPEREEEKDNLIQIHHHEMEITLAFERPFELITTHQDSLQKYFSYVSISDITHNIESDGWNINPKTPSSSLRNKGVKFIKGGEEISFTIDWSIYAVMGYRDSEKCNEELSIMDESVSEACYLTVNKNLPLRILVHPIPL